MKALRILLQLVILGASGFALAALISQPDFDVKVIIGFLVCVAFLLALTLALKEHTEARLIPGHILSFKPVGMVLILLGAFSVYYGVGFFIGNRALPNGNGTCRAVCGLILLASQLFGESVARLIGFTLWSGIGLFLCFVGYKVKSVKAT